MKIKCEKCGYKNEVNLGSLSAKKRWDNTSPEAKKKFIAKLNKARLEKKFSTG